MSTELARLFGAARHAAELLRAAAEAASAGVAAARARWAESTRRMAVAAAATGEILTRPAPSLAAGSLSPLTSTPVVEPLPAVRAARVARRRPIRRLDRAAAGGLALGVLAVGLAVFAQGSLGRQAFVADASLLLLAAGLLFARTATGVLDPLPGVGPAPLLASVVVGQRSRRLRVLLGAVVLLNAAGLALFGVAFAAEARRSLSLSALAPNLAWAFYALSVVLGVVGVWALDSRPGPRALIRRNRGALLALAVVLAAAAVVRLYRLAELPFGLWFDEAYNGLEILKIMADPSRRPVFVAMAAQGQPVMHWYATVPFVWLLGPTQLALRVPTALAGVAGVAAVFVLGRVLFGNVVGLTAAALLATMSWHLTLSRIAFSAVYSVALDAATLGLLVLALRKQRWSLFALSGVCLGLGQNFYYTSRLVVPVLLLYLLHRTVAGRTAFLRQHARGLALFVGFAVLTASPLALFAVGRPTEFNTRLDKVSVLQEIQERGSYQPLVDNVRKHLLMFNVQGDPNGRHNLPGAPMLERTTAALAVLGFVLALRRWRRSEYFVLLVWWAFMLTGGVFSLAYEAPQGLRTVDEVVVVALLAALPVAALAEHAARLAGRARMRLAGTTVAVGRVAATGIVAAGAVLVGAENLDRYFVRQAGHFGVWDGHSTAVTLVGREIAAGETTGRVYLSETYVGQPSIAFLAPGYRPQLRFDPASMLPLPGPEGATVFLGPGAEDAQAIETIRRMYPDAAVDAFRQRADGLPALFAVRVTAEEVARVQGVQARYWAAGEHEGDPLAVVRLPGLEAAGEGAPAPYPLHAEWKATLAARTFGWYAFKLEGPPTIGLRLDEREVTRGGGDAASVLLPRGTHALALVGTVDGPHPLRLLWRPPDDAAYSPVPRDALYVEPVTNNGLLGSYYPGTAWAGEPALQRIDPSLQLRFHILPLPRPYSVEWRGKIYIPSDGAYRFGTASRNESWIFLDGRLTAENARADGQYAEGTLTLTAGFHDIRVRFLDRSGSTFINLFWAPPGQAREPIPGALLFPPLGVYPEKAVAPRPPPAPVLPAPQPPPPAPAAEPVARRAAAAPDTPTLSFDAIATIGGAGTAPGQFNQPRAVALDRQGNLYVVDTANHRVQKLDPSGRPVTSWGSASELGQPFGVVVDSAGRVVVLDSEEGWLRRYTADGAFVDRIGGPDARLYHPRGLAIDAADNLYVADTGRSRVVKFAPSGEQTAVYGQKGSGPGQLTEPTGVATDATGGVWVADPTIGKLVRFGTDGGAGVELPLPKAGTVDGPHVAVGPDGSIVVTEPESGRLIVVGPDGAVRGAGRTEALQRPVGVAVAPDGRILVTDVKRHQVFALALLPGS